VEGCAVTAYTATYDRYVEIVTCRGRREEGGKERRGEMVG